MKYMVSNIDRPNNTPVYSIHSDLDSFILYNENDISEQVDNNEGQLSLPEQPNQLSNQENDTQNSSSPEVQNSDKYEIDTLWHMSFDGSYGKVGLGAGVWIHKKNEGHSYRLDFQCTNNITEYEALLIGLHLLKDLKASKILVQGNSEVIINKIKGEYLAKNLKLREYRNSSLDLLKTFEKYELNFIPRTQNCLANEFAVLPAIASYPMKIINASSK